MSHFKAYSSPLSRSPALIIALILATAIHLMALYKWHQHSNTPKIHHNTQTVAVTILHKASPKKPRNAEFLAIANQLGLDNKPQQKHAPSETVISPDSVDEIPAFQAAQTPLKHPDVITTESAKQKVFKPTKKPKLSLETLQQQLDDLGKKLRYQKNKVKRIKPLQLVNANHYVAAQYIADWKQKIERMGKLNFPNITHTNHRLVMDVGINADGSIHSLHIRTSSGSTQLDEAAKRIVLLSAPFPPLPNALLAELDTLVITRIWHFKDK